MAAYEDLGGHSLAAQVPVENGSMYTFNFEVSEIKY